jgi:hypothetical protein
MGGSPRAEDDGSGRILRVNRGGAVWTVGGGAAMQQGRRCTGFAGARAGAASGPASPFIGGSHTYQRPGGHGCPGRARHGHRPAIGPRWAPHGRTGWAGGDGSGLRARPGREG